jgi:hypothetical protein
MSNLSVALAGPLPVEVDFRATVTSPPRYFTGTVTNARHEAFDVRSDDGLATTSTSRRRSPSARVTRSRFAVNSCTTRGADRSFIGPITIPRATIPTAGSISAAGVTREPIAA